MGFFTGRVNGQSFRVSGKSAWEFGPEELAKLEGTPLIGKSAWRRRTQPVRVDRRRSYSRDTRFDLAKKHSSTPLQSPARRPDHRSPADLWRASYFRRSGRPLGIAEQTATPERSKTSEAPATAKEHGRAGSEDGRLSAAKGSFPALWDRQFETN